MYLLYLWLLVNNTELSAVEGAFIVMEDREGQQGHL